MGHDYSAEKGTLAHELFPFSSQLRVFHSPIPFHLLSKQSRFRGQPSSNVNQPRSPNMDLPTPRRSIPPSRRLSSLWTNISRRQNQTRMGASKLNARNRFHLRQWFVLLYQNKPCTPFFITKTNPTIREQTAPPTAPPTAVPPPTPSTST